MVYQSEMKKLNSNHIEIRTLQCLSKLGKLDRFGKLGKAFRQIRN